MALRLGYFIGETTTNLRRNLLLTIAAISTAALSLMLLGLVMVGGEVLKKAVGSWEGKVELNVFLRDEITPEQTKELGAAVSSMPEVQTVFYESKTEAYEEYKRMFKESPALIENVDPEALPASYRIKLKNPNTAEAVSTRLEGRPGVDDVQFGGEAVKRFLRFANLMKTMVMVVTAILMAATTLLIANTIRLAVYARRKEIGIMKLVGATNWFIRVPFILEGVAEAAVGAAVATGMLTGAKFLLLDNAQKEFPFLPVTVGVDVLLQVFLVLLAVGVVIGTLGSFLALRRFLEV